MHLLIGLGNPGEEYELTYHNVGRLAVTSWENPTKSWDEALLFEYQKHDNQVLVLPKTYMNESGAAVTKALAFFNATIEDLIVVHDDSDLPLGEYKVGGNMSSAGHNGVQSIIDALKTQDFKRVRIGIRETLPEEAPRKKAEDFVLKPISKKHLEALHGVFGDLREKLIEKVTP